MNSNNDNTNNLISNAERYILETFDTTSEEAKKHAEGLVCLIDAKGGDGSTFDFNSMRDIIDKKLSKLYEWKNNSRKEQATSRRGKTRVREQLFLIY